MTILAALRSIAALLVGGEPAVRARPLLTDREAGFCRLLRVAAAPLHVAPQVAMGALLDAAGSRAAFDRRIVDFVLIDDDGRVRLLVELDDRLHDRRRDAARDRLTAAAGYATLRVDGVVARDLHLLKTAVAAALGQPPSWTPPVFNPAGVPRRGRNRSAPPSSPRA